MVSSTRQRSYGSDDAKGSVSSKLKSKHGNQKSKRKTTNSSDSDNARGSDSSKPKSEPEIRKGKRKAPDSPETTLPKRKYIRKPKSVPTPVVDEIDISLPQTPPLSPPPISDVPIDDEYELIKKLGKQNGRNNGGVAIYKRRRDGMVVMGKRLDPQFYMAGAELPRDWRRAMEIMRKLRHPSMNQYIAGDIDVKHQRESVLDYGESGMLYTELCELGSLGDLLRRQTELDPKERTNLPEAFVWHVLKSFATMLRVLSFGNEEPPLNIEQATDRLNTGKWEIIISHVGLKIDNVFMKPATTVNEYPKLVLGDFGRSLTTSDYHNLEMTLDDDGYLGALPEWLYGEPVMRSYWLDFGRVCKLMDGSPEPDEIPIFEGGIIARQPDPTAYAEISAVIDTFRKTAERLAEYWRGSKSLNHDNNPFYRKKLKPFDLDFNALVMEQTVQKEMETRNLPYVPLPEGLLKFIDY